MFLFPLGWWSQAHAMIGAIAEKQLSKKQINILEQALNQNNLHFRSLTQATSWQDDLKDVSHLMTMGTWHFNDRHIVRDGQIWQGDTAPVDKMNIVSYLEGAWKTLMNPSTTNSWAFSFHLASILHFVGDIHTPHHNCALVSKQFPSGDNGGTKFLLNCELGSLCNHIHFFWDAASNELPNSDFLDQKRVNTFLDNVTRVMNSYPRSKFSSMDLKTPNFQLWSNESYEYAEKYGYPDLYLQYPPHNYFKLVADKSYERIAAAGYRLGEMLKLLADSRELLPGVEKSSSNWLEIFFWIFDGVILTVIVIAAILLFKSPMDYSFLA